MQYSVIYSNNSSIPTPISFFERNKINTYIWWALKYLFDTIKEKEIDI